MGRRVRLVGIYCITCVPINKKYIGSSIDICFRWNNHLGLLITGKHSNKKLQADFNKYGLCNFSFTILILAERNITKEKLLILEQLEIDSVHRGNLYNNKRAIAKK